MSTLRAALADDEPMARVRLSRLLWEAGLEVVCELENGPEVVSWFQAGNTVDVLFLDIQMPGLSGLELVEFLKDPPPVVFVTAFAEHALEAFDKAAIDYLLKPVVMDRLQRTLDRLRKNLIPKRSPKEIQSLVPRPQRYPVRAGEGVVLMELKRTSYFEVVKEVVWAVVGKERFRTTWTALAEVEAAFPDKGMLRIQRHQLLRPEAVVGFVPVWGGRVMARLCDGVEVEVSRAATPKLKAMLGLM